MIEFLKAILFGIVEGITEWLPISSTGHMILLKEFVSLNVSDEFWEMFLVVIQLGAILAVIILFWNKIWPFVMEKGKLAVKKDTMLMWWKVVIACVPAVIYMVTLEEIMDNLMSGVQKWVVAAALIIVGILFIVIEKWNRNKTAKITNMEHLTYKLALFIGLCQLFAGVFPGTSRSGATIIGALIFGVSRTLAAEFTFILAIPAMIGASGVKLLKFILGGTAVSSQEIWILLIGMAVAFAVSVFVIKFLMDYIRKHDFTVFGWYRIALGAIVLIYFIINP
ncbi:MAG: undecaprenyl-diphosphate phosphatase [Clostridia bacterium]|nr:undecaprenyl-diphosphate phosphatase [Clostridia bacterium]